ncbi:MAG: pyridoxamine 5'-phosphate oxidase family protein [Chloroflexi bacterium]|nr:pyridoxamine 5'-phosphate oxidase family protein [Chloroflexota bacterium]
MIQLTEEMRSLINNARSNGTPCILATASLDGIPNAGYRGTVMVFDDASLAYRERGTPVEHLEENPRVVVLYYDAGRQVGWKFRCTATVYTDGPIYQQVMDGLAALGLIQDPAITGAAVVLQVDQVLTNFGELLQERVPGQRW